MAIGSEKLIPKETVPAKKAEFIQISTPKLMAKADSLKTPAKKRNM
ncbi:hypothetical protein OWR28_24460 [Chryseobacterium sp. 1B4]